MIDRNDLERRLLNLRAQRGAQARHLEQMQLAVQTAERTCLQIDGAITVLEAVLQANGAEEGNDVHAT